MKSLNNVLSIVAFFLLLFAIAMGCGGDDDDDDDTSSDDDDDDNDDTDSDDDDDNNDDNDDDNDNDTTPDDDDDDDDNDDDDLLSQDPYIVAVDGGAPGQTGTSIVTAANGTDYIAAVRARKLRVYSFHDRSVTSKVVASYAAYPDMVIDQAGKLHLAFHDTLNEDLVYANNIGGTWNLTAVDSEGNVGIHPSIALGPDGSIHISYCTDGGNIWTPCDDLKYASNAGGSWNVETVYQPFNGGISNDIAVDSAGHAHISFGAKTNPLYSAPTRQMYATNQSGSWATKIVDTRNTGLVGSIALDENDVPHIAYNYFHQPYPDFYFHELIYSHLQGSAWVTEQVGFAAGGNPKIRIDDDNRIHIICLKSGILDSGFKHVTREGSAWVWEDAIPPDTIAEISNIDFVVDTDGKVRLSYYDDGLGHLKHISNDSGAWEISDVDLHGLVLSTAFALDFAGHVHIAYSYGTQEFAHVLRYATDRDGEWSIQEVDSTPRVYGVPAIRVHSDGSVHIIANDYHADALVYYTNSSGQWVMETADDGSTHEVDEFASMILDENGNVHVSYNTYDGSQSAYRVYYATNESGSWINEVVDPVNNAFYHSSIALDSQGYAVIAYYAINPRYATNRTGLWVSEIIDPAVGFGENIALTLAPDDSPHVTYCDSDGEQLRYAANDSGSWINETINSNTWVYYYQTALAMDADGFMHGLYGTYLANRGALMYFTNETGSWVNVEIDGAGEIGGSPALALESDGNDQVHAVYVGEGTCWYAVFPQGTSDQSR